MYTYQCTCESDSLFTANVLKRMVEIHGPHFDVGYVVTMMFGVVDSVHYHYQELNRSIWARDTCTRYTCSKYWDPIRALERAVLLSNNATIYPAPTEHVIDTETPD